MLDWLYTALGAMMRFFNTITGTYALALLLYALIFKLVFLPFTIKQQKNQIKMAKLTPKIELIKAKYKGRTDQPTMQKQQQEIMELQQKEGYSPMSGCLPLLIQFPIIILLYAVIQSPLSYIAKPTDSFKDYNDNYSSVTVAGSEYEDMLAHYGITDENKKELNRTDIAFQLYLDFSSDSQETKDELVNTFNETKSSKGSDKAYKNLKKTLKTKEIALVGDIRNFVDGDSIPEALADRFSGATEQERRDYITGYGIEYSSIPNFVLWGINLAAQPSLKNLTWPQGILCIIPFLAAAAQWFSMWLTRKLNGNGGATAAQDAQSQASMKIMDLVMPAMTVFFAFSFSGMLGIYWVYQSVLGLVTSLILAKLMPLPKFTEEEIKELRRQQKEIEKEQRAAAKKGPKYRSLHYIDDEDYEELPPVPGENKSQGGKKMGSDIPEIKD